MKKSIPVHKSLLLLFLVSFSIPSLSFAASGEQLTVQGYSFDISADQLSNAFIVRGSISGGESCKKLIANISFRDDSGNSAHTEIILNDYESYQTFSSRKPIHLKRSRQWTVSNIHIKRYK